MRDKRCHFKNGKATRKCGNDVLPLKAARHNAGANLKCFGVRDTIDLISMVSFTFIMRRCLIPLASAPFTTFRLAKFGWVSFREIRVQRLVTKHNAEFTENK